MSEPTADQANAQTPTKRKGVWLIPVAVLLVAALLFLLIRTHWDSWRSSGLPATSDAYVHANIVPLSTQASGTLRALNVRDYQRVKAGELIAQIDEAATRAQVEQAESALAEAEAALHDNQVQKRAQAERVVQQLRGVDVSLDDERLAQDKASGADAQARYTSQERARQERLYGDQATTRQTLERTVSQDEQTHASLAAARADTAKAGDSTSAQRAVLAQDLQNQRLLDAKDEDLRAEIRQRVAAVKAAQVQLNYTQIHAPVDGLVTERKAFPGQFISPGVEIISLVEGDLWVQANFEETQLGRMRAGDAADIRIDAIPGKVFHGSVIDLSPASGSQTSLLPPDNATGNFTKVIQRIPVKISIEDSDTELGRLRPGFSCEIKVHASGPR